MSGLIEQLDLTESFITQAEHNEAKHRLLGIELKLRSGLLLIELKAETPHGKWLQIIANLEKPIHEREAQRRMRLAREYGSEPVTGAQEIEAAGGIKAALEGLSGKSDTVSDLNEPSSMATPAEMVEDLDKLEGDNRELRAENHELKRKARQDAKAELAALEQGEMRQKASAYDELVERLRVLEADDKNAQLVLALRRNDMLEQENITLRERLQKMASSRAHFRKWAYDNGYNPQQAF